MVSCMFWENYILLCNKIGKAPNVVAAECGVKSTGTVTGWKNGAMPRDNILLALAKYFDVSVEWLKGETNEKKPVPVRHELSEEAKELQYIWDEIDADERQALLEMARLIKKRRDKQ